ncbi:MAG TPA: hypothetical protein VKA34_08750 [Balneolales bacterium]|nr:hypothetical protein [Balneolales bacterium]
MKKFKATASSLKDNKKQKNTPENYEAPKLRPLGKWQPRTLFAYYSLGY